MENGDKKREIVAAVVLVVCLVVVIFWEVMGHWSRRGRPALGYGPADFAAFAPDAEGWLVRRRDVAATANEPTILAFDFIPQNHEGTSLAHAYLINIRLVHGYNMVDCMRIKGYKVRLLSDGVQDGGARLQVWRLENSVGDLSIWVTGMLNAGDFEPLSVSTTDMLFPRVGIPDNPDWLPRGITWSSFRHPVKNMRMFLRAKWNAARCDPMVFLRLKQPAWLDDEVLTLVADSRGTRIDKHNEADVIRLVTESHGLFHAALKRNGAGRE